MSSARFYHAPLKPLPDDRLESQIVIDRPEIEGLIIAFLAVDARQRSAAGVLAARRLTRPSPNSAAICDLMAGWTVRSAA